MIPTSQIIDIINVLGINLFILSIPLSIVLVMYFIYLMNKNSIEYTGYSIFHHRSPKVINNEPSFMDNLPKYE